MSSAKVAKLPVGKVARLGKPAPARLLQIVDSDQENAHAQVKLVREELGHIFACLASASRRDVEEMMEEATDFAIGMLALHRLDNLIVDLAHHAADAIKAGGAS